MESAALAAFTAAVPQDERVQIKKMFGTPCAFVNRQMFFGTFEETVVARIGPDRVHAVAGTAGFRVFTLSPDKVWDDYVQVEATTEAEVLTALAREALAWTAALPVKAKMSKKQRLKLQKRAAKAAVMGDDLG